MTGTLLLPTPAEVSRGVPFGAGGTQYLGTLNRSGGVVRLVDSTTKLIPSTGKRVATQGVNPWDLVAYFRDYVMLVTGLDARHVRVWFGPSRPHLQGSDMFVWFRPASDDPDHSTGPGRWGNRSAITMEVHLLLRHMSDQSQIDDEKGRRFYLMHWKLEQAFQGLNLFKSYEKPPTSGLWHPPEPSVGEEPLTFEPMSLSALAVPDKKEKEEGTVEAVLPVKIPIVLALTVP